MKAFMMVVVFCSVTVVSAARGVYRQYLLSTISSFHKPAEVHEPAINSTLSPAAYIPRFERPRGAIFCRMEDKVTKATKVWLKIGVE